MVASETCAFDLLNAQYVRDIEPGEMLRISRAGLESIHFSAAKPHQYCIFEHVYFSRPDSIVFGRVGERVARNAGAVAGTGTSSGSGHDRAHPGLWRAGGDRLLRWNRRFRFAWG